MSKQCEYCIREICTCGAEKYKKARASQRKDGGLGWYPYNGYIVWAYRNLARKAFEFYFYLGKEVVGESTIEDCWLLDNQIDECEDITPYALEMAGL